MLQAQLDISATDAFARLRAYAFTSGRPVNDVARDVVGRTLDFSTLTD
jgi:AmiR/NasT family two-component response regulator